MKKNEIENDWSNNFITTFLFDSVGEEEKPFPLTPSFLYRKLQAQAFIVGVVMC